MKRPAIIFLLLFVFITLLSGAGISEAGIVEHVQETTLPNGLKVILLENHKAPVVTFQVWYRVGSRNESWGKTGLSHMLEHMMFKGTEKVGPEEFSRIIQGNGGNDNAFTSSDCTAYYTNISADRVNIPLELEADRMQNLVLREKDFQTERMVVMEERRLRTEDNPQAFLYEQVEAAAYQIQPYHWPTIGWMEDIEHFTLEDIKGHYATYYNPANAFIVVVGDVRKETFFPMIEKAFGPIRKGRAPDQARDTEQPQRGERRVVVKREAQTPSLVMGYHVPNIHGPDGYVLEVIEGILSGGKSSRLYRQFVRDKQLVVDISAGNSLLSRDPGLFYISASIRPGKDIAQIETLIDKEIERLWKEPVGDDEMQKVKNQLEALYVYSQDSPFHQAMMLARYEIASGWRDIDEYIPAIRKISPEDIMRVAKQYLRQDNRTVGVLVPISPKAGKALEPAPVMKEQMTR